MEASEQRRGGRTGRGGLGVKQARDGGQGRGVGRLTRVAYLALRRGRPRAPTARVRGSLEARADAALDGAVRLQDLLTVEGWESVG